MIQQQTHRIRVGVEKRQVVPPVAIEIGAGEGEWVTAGGSGHGGVEGDLRDGDGAGNQREQRDEKDGAEPHLFIANAEAKLFQRVPGAEPWSRGLELQPFQQSR